MRICPHPRQSQTSPSKDDSGDASAGSPAHCNIFSESFLVEILKQIFEVVAFARLLRRSGDEDVLFVPGGPERDRCRMLKLYLSEIMK